MTPRRPVLFEGYTPEQLLALPDEMLAGFVFTGEPLVFRVGSAEVLGEFHLIDQKLLVELAQTDGGGEGILRSLWIVVERFARTRGLTSIEWIVHAVNCADPNLKLRRVLDRAGFVIRDVPSHGRAYHLEVRL